MNKVLEFFIKAKDLSTATIQKVVASIKNWGEEAEKASKKVAAGNKNAAKAIDSVSDSMKKTSVNWESIKQAEEAAKKRTAEIIALKKELAETERIASKATGEAAEAAKAKAEMLQKGIKQLSQQGTQDFNAMEMGMSALNGNIEGVAKNVINLCAKFKLLGMSMAMMSVYTVALMSVIKLFTWWKGEIDECNKKIRETKMDGLKTQFEQLGKQLEFVNKELTDNVKLLDQSTKHQNALADASVALQKAKNEHAREAELSNTTDEDERAAINRKYDKANADINVQGRKEKFARSLDAEREKLAKTEETIAQNEMLLREAIAKKDAAIRERKQAFEDSGGDKEDEDYKAAEERAKTAIADVEKFSESKKSLQEQRQLSKDLIAEMEASNRAVLWQDKADAAKREREAADAERKVNEAKIKEDENAADELEGIWSDWYKIQGELEKQNAAIAKTDKAFKKNFDIYDGDELKEKNRANRFQRREQVQEAEFMKQKADLVADYYDALAQVSDDVEREQVRAEYERQNNELQFVKDLADEQLRLDKEVEEARAALVKSNKEAQHKVDIQNAKDNLAAANEQKTAAQSRLQAAQGAVAQAWGWYRNKDALARQREEWTADSEARKQYSKDLYSLQHGRNADKFGEALYLSRRGHTDKLEEQMTAWRKKGLSVEDEATMRMAIAQDEEKRATQALVTIEEHTAAIGEILKVLQGGGEQE